MNKRTGWLCGLLILIFWSPCQAAVYEFLEDDGDNWYERGWVRELSQPEDFPDLFHDWNQVNTIRVGARPGYSGEEKDWVCTVARQHGQGFDGATWKAPASEAIVRVEFEYSGLIGTEIEEKAPPLTVFIGGPEGRPLGEYHVPDSRWGRAVIEIAFSKEENVREITFLVNDLRSEVRSAYSLCDEGTARLEYVKIETSRSTGQ